VGAKAYHSSWYDHYFIGVEGDVEFYVEEAVEAGSPVLELGSGSGRILLPTAAAGIRVVGVEPDEEMLAVCRKKLTAADSALQDKVELVQGDMQTFALDQTFGLVTIPYRTFQHLLNPVDQQEALENIHTHLEDDGLLVFNVFDPLRDIAAGTLLNKDALHKDTDFIDPHTGHRVVVWYSRQYDPQVQLLEQEIIYEEIDEHGRSSSRTYGRLDLRYTPRGEMEYLLERCGFAVEALYGDFTGQPFEGFGEQVWVARKV